MIKPSIALALLALPTNACGEQRSDADFARYVAADVQKDCLSARSQAPNAAFAHHLDRLCDCTYKKIASTPMGPGEGDNDDTVSGKVQAALASCDRQLGGLPDAEDYKAVGMQVPINSPPR